MKQNIHLFFGEDSFQMKEKLNLWKNEFKKKYDSDMNMIMLNEKSITADDLIEASKTIPFLAEKKLVIVVDFLKNAKEGDTKKFLKFLEDGIPEHAVIVMQENAVPDKRKSLYKRITKLGHKHEFNYMSAPEMSTWIYKQAPKKIDYGTAAFLISQTGGELWKAEKELEKLIAYSGDTKITKQMVEELVMPSLHSSVFKLTDSIAAKQPKMAFRILHILIDSGEDPYKILFMIVRHFRILIQVKDLLEQNYNKGEITSTLKQHPYVIMTTMQQAHNFSMDELKHIYRALLQIDIDIKTGNIRMSADNKKEFCLNLEKFFLNCCA